MAGNFAEFGAEESGARSAELDHQKDVASTIQGLMHIAQTQEAEARLPLIRAEARKTGAEADTLEQKATVQRKMAAMMAGRQPTGGGGNLAYDMADIAGAAGDVDTATKLLVRGSQVETNNATRRWRDAEVETQQLTQLGKAATLAGSLANAALADGTQEGYDRMRAQAQAMGLNVGDLPPDFASAREILVQHAAQGMTVQQYVNAEIAKRRQATQEENVASLLRARNAQVSTNDSRRRLIDQRLSDAVKNGGERSAEARELKQESIKLSKSRRALVDMQTAGRSIENPRPLPLANGKADEKQLAVGQFYSNSKGQVGRWNGKQMELVQPGAKIAPPSDADVLGEEDDNADEE